MDKVTVIDQSAEVTNPPSGTVYVQKAEIDMKKDAGMSANAFLFVIILAFLVITIIIYKAVSDVKKNKLQESENNPRN